jgi:hypothetical protein
VRSDDTEVSFVLKPAKGAESFEPSVGAKVPNALKLHPLPPPLIYQMTTLEALCIYQIQAPGADCESDDAQDRRHVSGILGSCGKRTTRLQTTDAGAAGETVPGFHPGRFTYSAALRRHWVGPCHLPQLARMMGGDVTVTSEPGKGSVFTVRLPGTPDT